MADKSLSHSSPTPNEVAAAGASGSLGRKFASELRHFAAEGLAEEDRIHVANYLRTLRERLLHLALGELDIWQAVDSTARLDLKDIFTEGPVSWSPPRKVDDAEAGEQRHMLLRFPGDDGTEERQPASTTAFAAAHDRAVLLGDPGSGKSTYLAMLALCHAGEILVDEHLSLSLLPDWDAEKLPALLPIHIILREYAGKDEPLWDYFLETLPQGNRDALGDAIKRILHKSGGLVLLDGLDEVPVAENCRERLRRRIGEFRETFPQARILVTSRTYAYQRDGWRLEHFDDARLLPFNKPERAAFLVRWFAHAAPKRGISTYAAENRRDSLQSQIEGRDHLRVLAKNPLLLTLICLHDFQTQGNVPEDREELYSRSVELLLEIWQKPRLIDPTSGQTYPRLEDYLGVTRKELQGCLENLALQFHRLQGDQPGLADIPAGDFLAALDGLRMGRRPVGNAGPSAPSLDVLRGYVEDRTGIISHHGSVYRFAHRTFQEYLAACALAKKSVKAVVEQVREEPANQWREVYLLAGARMRDVSDSLWRLLDKSVRGEPPENRKDAEDTDWRMAALAGRLLREAHPAVDGDEDDRSTVDRIRRWLAAMIEAEVLPLVAERLPAAMDLGHLGDPRPGVGLNDDGLPDIGWVPVPEGTFVCQDEPAEIETSYAISRYPITVAQYGAFVAADGYRDEKWWFGTRDDGGRWDGRDWLRNSSNGGPRRFDKGAFQPPNHPQVGVCWFEAMAFCEWLSARLGMPIRLPHEREWERAAAGGGDGPRLFPWGGAANDEEAVVASFANIGKTGIGHTSPVGLLPRGDAREGEFQISDLSGNVWEWCENFSDKEESLPALRGGAFFSSWWVVRASYRGSAGTGRRLNDVGFRVLSPDDYC